MSEHSVPELDLVLAAAAQRKVEHPVVLDVRGKSSVADYFVILSGRSSRQATALAEHIQSWTRDHGVRPLGVEGMAEGQWILMDYGDVVLHIFYDPVRSFYDLEGLWADAPRVELPEGMFDQSSKT
ncbi:MAG: ribosome silencing factor [Desulfatibacillaceae bacterium]